MAVYRGQLAGALPADLSGQAAAAAQDTLGGAVGVAAQLPRQLGRSCWPRPARRSSRASS